MGFIKRNPTKNSDKSKPSTISNEDAEKNLRKRFRKINDPNFSLYQDQYKGIKFLRPIMLGFIVIGTAIFIPGVVMLARRNVFGVIPLTFGSLGVMMIIMLPIFLPMWRRYKKIDKLLEQKQFDKLLELSKKYSASFGVGEQELAKLATNVLVDTKSLEIGHILKQRIDQHRPVNLRDVLSNFYLLAIKLGYNDHYELYQALEQGTPPPSTGPGIRQPERSPLREKVDMDVVVPISKIYFVDKPPTDAKCMISGLPLDIVRDTIVVCPYCSAWAKKNLLATWLRDKNYCPVCRRDLILEDCPIVKLNK